MVQSAATPPTSQVFSTATVRDLMDPDGPVLLFGEVNRPVLAR